MNYVLSYVRPPESGAAFGKATVLGLYGSVDLCMGQAANVLSALGVPDLEANNFAIALGRELTGTERVHTGSGLVFRIDPVDRAPNACPCCGRIVNWTDHALAGSDDAYCLGCFTWDRVVPACLPENTAHATEERNRS